MILTMLFSLVNIPELIAFLLTWAHDIQAETVKATSGDSNRLLFLWRWTVSHYCGLYNRLARNHYNGQEHRCFTAHQCPRYETPDIIWSDQGPQFTSCAFKSLTKTRGFRHVMSSPAYPQSNDKAESAVKSMKNSLKTLGLVTSWKKISWHKASYYIVTHHLEETECHLHRNSSGAPFKTPYQPLNESSNISQKPQSTGQ